MDTLFFPLAFTGIYFLIVILICGLFVGIGIRVWVLLGLQIQLNKQKLNATKTPQSEQLPA